MIEVYGIKSCGSVKKALSFFKTHNLAYNLNDLKTKELPCSKIEEWLQKVPMKTLFNAKSATYRNLKLKEQNLDELGQKEWLCKENLLIKRPVIEHNGELEVGFDEEIYTRRFL